MALFDSLNAQVGETLLLCRHFGRPLRVTVRSILPSGRITVEGWDGPFNPDGRARGDHPTGRPWLKRPTPAALAEAERGELAERLGRFDWKTLTLEQLRAAAALLPSAHEVG